MGIEKSGLALVSIVIPVYNSSKTIEKTLESVLSQDYQNLEIIIVNDGSTDNTEEILKKYENKIKYLYQKNSGVSFARNLGFSKSVGKYIQYLDSDDLLARGKISTQVKALENCNADVAYGDWVKFKEMDFNFIELETIIRQFTKKPEIELLTDFWVPLSALLYSRKIANKIGGWNTTLPIIQDARYALDAAINNAKFVYTPGVMGYYRVNNSDSLSTSNKFKFINDCFENVKQVDEIWRNDYLVDQDKKNAIINVLRFCINEFSKLDKYKFNEAVNLVLEIDKNYIPQNSASLRLLSQMLGYKLAEKIAYYKRKLS